MSLQLGSNIWWYSMTLVLSIFFFMKRKSYVKHTRPSRWLPGFSFFTGHVFQIVNKNKVIYRNYQIIFANESYRSIRYDRFDWQERAQGDKQWFVWSVYGRKLWLAVKFAQIHSSLITGLADLTNKYKVLIGSVFLMMWNQVVNNSENNISLTNEEIQRNLFILAKYYYITAFTK